MRQNMYNKKRTRIRFARIIMSLLLLAIIIGGGFFVVKKVGAGIFSADRNKVINVKTALSFKSNNPLEVIVKEEMDKANELKIEEEYETKKAEVEEKMIQRRLNMEKAVITSEDDRKIAYLTFDDGPSTKSTPRILEILDKYNIKATFFVLGKNCDYYPDILKTIHEKGHAIGNHSYTHVYKTMYANKEAFFAEVEQCDQTIKKYLGDDFNSKLLRFPGGCFGAAKQKLKRQILEEKGYVSYNWNSLNGDSEGALFSREHLFKRFVETAGSQKKLIVLMHDTNAKSTTPDALVDIIEYLIEKGYEFATLPS